MKTPPFEYHAPGTLDDALALLAEHGDEATVLAGGQSLVPLLAMRLARPAHLVDLNGVDGLAGIADRGDVVAVGTMTRERDAERAPVIRDKVPLLAEALPLVGHVAIRNRGTVGGSMAHADAAAELPAVALATEAEMVLRSRRGERTVRADDFFLGHFTTAKADDECLVEVRFPASPPDAGWAFEEVARRHGDFALVGVGAMVALDGAGSIREARLALLGVAERPVRAHDAEAAVVGAAPSADAFTAAGQAAAADLEPGSDIHGSSGYRRHLAAVTVRRALTRAAERAGGGR